MSKVGLEFAPRREDSAACLAAFELHLDYVFTTLRRMRVPLSDREDLAHSVFLALWTSWPSVDPDRPLRPYVFGVIFRIVCAYRRKAFRPLPLQVVRNERESSATPHELLQSERAKEIVLSALEAVPLMRRAVLVMHYIDGVRVEEVARALSIPTFTVYARLRKGRRELSAAIRRRLGASAAL